MPSARHRAEAADDREDDPGHHVVDVHAAGVMLRNGPFPARIMRVMVRVIAKVRMKAASARSSGSLPGSVMFSYHQ